MKWSSKASEDFSLKDAVDECVTHIRAELGDAPPDLAVAFISAHHTPDFENLPLLLKERLGPRMLLGCSGGGVIGGGTEIEERAGFALTAAYLPGVEVSSFHVEDQDLPDMDAGPAAWEHMVGVAADKSPDFVVLAEPFSLHADNLVAGMDYAFPGRVKVGGLASGASQPGGNALFLGERLYRSGAVGVAMHGDVRVDTVVAQGCRPIGEPVVVTKCHQNVLLELNEQRPMDVLRSVFDASPERDQALINRALHLGVVMDPLKQEHRQGDFLIRNVVGIHEESGGIIIGEMLREGQVVQFHVRDADTAQEDLQTMLRQYADSHGPSSASGALLFSCLGRGMHLFGRPDHDTDLFREEVGPISLGGFFCNGEIGPVGPSTFLHGFTSSFAIFSPR